MAITQKFVMMEIIKMDLSMAQERKIIGQATNIKDNSLLVKKMGKELLTTKESIESTMDQCLKDGGPMIGKKECAFSLMKNKNKEFL